MSLVRRYPLASFFVLAYAIAWGAIPWGSFFAPGVLIAALIVVSITQGWEGLRGLGARLLRWRVSWVWYALALAVPLGVHLVVTGLNLSFGGALNLDQFRPWYGIFLVLGMNMVNPTGGQLSEEPSFRGFAQVGLQTRYTPLVATAILSVLVTGWHLPLVLLPNFGITPVELLATVAVTFWYAWLFNHTGGSILLVVIAHNVEGSIQYELGWIVMGVWLVVAIGLVVFDWKAWRSPAPAPATTQFRTAPPSGAVPAAPA